MDWNMVYSLSMWATKFCGFNFCVNGSWQAKNTKINPSRKLPVVLYYISQPTTLNQIWELNFIYSWCTCRVMPNGSVRECIPSTYEWYAVIEALNFAYLTISFRLWVLCNLLNSNSLPDPHPHTLSFSLFLPTCVFRWTQMACFPLACLNPPTYPAPYHSQTFHW